MQRITRFYGLVNPLDGSVFYVGRTTQKLAARLRNHIRDGIKIRTNKGKYIAEILAKGKEPIIYQIEALPDLTKEQAVDKEQHWIDYLRDKGWMLTNTGKAGMGGHGGENAIILMDEAKIEMLGTFPDRVLAEKWGCDRKTVTYHRNKLGIEKCGFLIKPKPPNVGGWNRKEFPQWVHERLGKQSDISLATELGVCKSVIARLRRRKGILSYADNNGHPTKFKKGNPHPRWSKLNQLTP